MTAVAPVAPEKQFRLLHVVKTGGTSVARHMERHGVPSSVGNEIGKKNVRNAVYIQGHDLQWNPEDDALYGIILRDPAEWYVSVYHHDMARKPGGEIPFSDWYEMGGVNTVIPQGTRYNRQAHYAGRFCGGIENVEGMLRSLWWVATTETLDQDIRKLCAYFSIPSELERHRETEEYNDVDKFVIPRRFKLTDRWRERIYRENPIDVAIYDLARALR